MPKLVMFVACEKVIIDQDNNISLISVLNDLKGEIPESSLRELPPGAKAIAAIRWTALSMWFKTEADEGKEFEQRIALIDPSGTPTEIKARSAFRFDEGKTTMRNIFIVAGFPIHLSGRYMLRLWMNEKGRPEPGEPIAEYPINVKFEQPKD